MTNNFPTVVVSRRARRLDSEWRFAKSWFGGAPRLNGVAWPRGANGRPSAFLAQVDLAQLARIIGPSALPREGALAFFIEAVALIPPGEAGPTPPPADLPPVLESGRGIFPENWGPSVQQLFPYWPIDFTRIEEPVGVAYDDDDPEPYTEAIGAAVAARFGKRQYVLSVEQAFGGVDPASRPRWRLAAKLYADALVSSLHHSPTRIKQLSETLRYAREGVAKVKPQGLQRLFGQQKSEELKKAESFLAGAQTRYDAYVAAIPAFERFIGEARLLASGDPAEILSPNGAARLDSLIARGRRDFEDFVRYYTPFDVAGLETDTLIALATADDRAYATLPQAVRNVINEQCLMPASYWHQMFGRGVDIQGGACDEHAEGNIMLMQLVYDDMMLWRFGDVGTYQFWISPEDLARGNFTAARVTFECH